MIEKKLRSVKQKEVLKKFVEKYRAHKESDRELKELKESVLELFSTKFSTEDRESVIAEENDKFLTLYGDTGIIVKDILTISNELDNTKLLKQAIKGGYLDEVAKVAVGKLAKYITTPDLDKYIIETSIKDRIVVE